MSKLYFKYGAMGSSKTAQALMCKFNYEQKGYRVLIMKSKLDVRDKRNGEIIIKSRIGLSSPCELYDRDINLYEYIKSKNFFEKDCAVIIDECQFLTRSQVDELHDVSRFIPVLCYGLLTNYKTELFEGSKRLIEIAESIQEIKSVCKCGKKATTNALFVNGKLVTDGGDIVIGGDECYEGMCYDCYQKLLKQQKD